MANFNSAAKSAMQIQVILQGSTGYKSFLFTSSFRKSGALNSTARW